MRSAEFGMPLLWVLLTLAVYNATPSKIGQTSDTNSNCSASKVEVFLNKLVAEDGDSAAPNFDKLHEAVIQDQWTHYIEPIKSLHTRHTINLNGLYDFCFDHLGEGFKKRWFSKPLSSSCKHDQLHQMPVPSAFNEILSQEEAKNYVGWFWYQTELAFDQKSAQPSCDKIKGPAHDWLIQFDNINYLALIWAQTLDGEPKFLGAHAGGYLPVVVNISDLVNHQLEVTQLRLTVAVSNQLTRETIPSGQMVNLSEIVGKPLFKFQPDFDFFHFAGLMGDVQLVRLPKFHVRPVIVTRRTVSGWRLKVCINGLQDDESQKMRLIGPYEAKRILDYYESDYNNNTHSKCVVWLLDQKQDYRKSSTGKLKWRERTFMRLEGACGLEVDLFEIKIDDRPINGHEKLKMMMMQQTASGQLQGFGMHQEQLFSGRAMSLPAIMKDLYLVKQVGANVIRTSHYPYSSAYLNACDELDIMVIAECAAVGLNSFSDQKLHLHKLLLREMLLRDHDHQAIVMWSLANEPASQLPEARPYFKSLLEFARTELGELIGNRPLTAAIAQSHQADQVGDLLDVLMINRYYAWYDYTGALETIEPALRASLEGWARKLPGKPLLVSEFGADTLIGLHSQGLFSEQYQRKLIEEHEQLFDELANERNSSQLNFIGSLIWNFADFSTHDSLLRPGGNRKGIFTIDRQPKLAAESVARIYRKRATSGELLHDNHLEL